MLLGVNPVARRDQEAEDQREQAGHEFLHGGDGALGPGQMLRRQVGLQQVAGHGADEDGAGGEHDATDVAVHGSPK